MTTASQAAQYWEQRAVRFSRVHSGLPAVCSYGMPKLYNKAIHVSQALALHRWIKGFKDLDILDVGCGVGRWSMQLAKQGNRVTGVDISQTMIETAKDNCLSRDLNCDFHVSNAQSLDVGKQFDVVIVVTVLQHILDLNDLSTAFDRLKQHLKPGGRLILLEVAPGKPNDRCDTRIFRARPLEAYLTQLRRIGMKGVAIGGVDLAPLRPILLPAIRKFPGALGRIVLTAITVFSLPFDALFSRFLPGRCWHKVIVSDNE